MEISYRRESSHNYLVVDGEEGGAGYEARMLAGNDIRGLLHMRIRYQDGHPFYYYDITSRQPLSRLLENRFVTRDEICQIMIQIHVSLTRMEEYLLGDGGLLLEPEYIYAEPELFQTGLCMVPGRQRNFQEGLSRFLQYILKRVNHKDRECVVLAYGLYQESLKDNCGMDELLRLIPLEKGKGRDVGPEQLRAAYGVSEEENLGTEGGDGGKSDRKEAPPEGVPHRKKKYKEVPQRGAPYVGMPQREGPYVKMPQRGNPYVGVPQRGEPYVEVPQRGGPYVGTPQGGAPYVEMPQRGEPYVGIHQEGVPYAEMQQRGVPYAEMQQRGAPYAEMQQRGVSYAEMQQRGVSYAEMSQRGELPQRGVPYMELPQGEPHEEAAYKRTLQGEAAHEEGSGGTEATRPQLPVKRQAGLWLFAVVILPAFLWLFWGRETAYKMRHIFLMLDGVLLLVMAVYDVLKVKWNGQIRKGSWGRKGKGENPAWKTDEDGSDDPWRILYEDDEKPEIPLPEETREPFQEGEESFQTVLLTERTPQDSPHRLEGVGVGAEDIAIPYFPFVIGKHNSLADYVLSNDAVSRFHIRIDKDEKGYSVTDLNSTNGTRVRGRLLDANETTEVEPGDEIQIADLTYIFQ